MAKISLPSITNGQDLTTLNSNFSKIATALNTNVLYRTNPIGEPNSMSQDLDFNGFRAYNVSDILINGVSVNTSFQTQVVAAQLAATQSQSYAANASAASNTATTQAANAQASAVAAAASAAASGTLKQVNNLSDLQSVVTAKVNLGLDQVNNTADASKPVSTAQANALALKANTLNPTFNGFSTITGVGSYYAVNDTGVGTPGYQFQRNGNLYWQGYMSPSNNFGIGRYASNTLLDTPVSIDTANGGVTVKGINNGSAVAAGYIGETIETGVDTATSVGLGVATNGFSITLSSGIWMITGHVTVSATTVTGVSVGISTVSVTFPAIRYTTSFQGSGGFQVGMAPTRIVNISASTSYYIVFQATGTGTATFTGKLTAVRIA